MKNIVHSDNIWSMNFKEMMNFIVAGQMARFKYTIERLVIP